MFFDLLDDDDIVDLNPPAPPTATPTTAQNPGSLHVPMPARTTRNSSSLVAPVPVAWPELIDLDAESSKSEESGKSKDTAKAEAEFTRDGQTQKVEFPHDGQTQKVEFAHDDQTQKVEFAQNGQTQKLVFAHDGQTQKLEFTRDGQTQKVLSEDEEDYALSDDEDIKPSTGKAPRPPPVAAEEAEKKRDMSESQTTSHRSRSGKNSKHTTFEAIRGDMEGLKLDVKISRQKDNIDEQQKLLRVGAHRQRGATTEGGESGLMQSERSDQLLAKNKRQKLLGNPSQSQGESLSTADVDPLSQNLGLADRSASVHILEEADRKDWPQQWKERPNFKTRAVVDPVLEAKWKERPNFKTFRKVREQVFTW